MRRSAFALFLVAALAGCERPAPLEVADAWTRDSVGGTDSAAVFMTITSPDADRLVAASTPAAAKTDLMTMQVEGGEGEGGSMAMKYLEAIDIPSGEPVSLDPSGLHVWLTDLDAPLKAGETFPLTLEFENAGRREVTVSVIAPAAPAPMAGMEMSN